MAGGIIQNVKDGINQMTSKSEEKTAEASKEVNKDVAKDSDASAGTRYVWAHCAHYCTKRTNNSIFIV